MKKNIWVIILAVFCIIALAGEAYSCIPHSYGYGSDASVSGTDVRYSLTTDGSREYKAVLLDNGDYTSVSSVYIYYDQSYPFAVDENVWVEVGGQKMTQAYYIDQVTRILAYRGISDVTQYDANGLRDRLVSDIADGTSVAKGLIFASGAIPDTVISSGSSGILESWIESGGSMYWVGESIGRYIAHPDGLEECTALAQRLIGTDDVCTEEHGLLDATDTYGVFPFENYKSMYSVNVSDISDSLTIGFTDGIYSDVSFVKKGNGQICVVADVLSSKQARDLSIAITSGLCYCSKIVEVQSGNASGRTEGSMDISTIPNKAYLYLYMGGYLCVYGKGYQVA